MPALHRRLRLALMVLVFTILIGVSSACMVGWGIMSLFILLSAMANLGNSTMFSYPLVAVLGMGWFAWAALVQTTWQALAAPAPLKTWVVVGLSLGTLINMGFAIFMLTNQNPQPLELVLALSAPTVLAALCLRLNQRGLVRKFASRLNT